MRGRRKWPDTQGPRAYDRILKVARTVADMAGQGRPGRPEIVEAVQCRSFDRTPRRSRARGVGPRAPTLVEPPEKCAQSTGARVHKQGWKLLSFLSYVPSPHHPVHGGWVRSA